MMPKNAKRLSVDLMLQRVKTERVETRRIEGNGFISRRHRGASMRRAYNMAASVCSKKMAVLDRVPRT
jgi:hypothetical protein